MESPTPAILTDKQYNFHHKVLKGNLSDKTDDTKFLRVRLDQGLKRGGLKSQSGLGIREALVDG